MLSSGHHQSVSWLGGCSGVPAGFEHGVDWVSCDAASMVAPRDVDVAVVTPGTSILTLSSRDAVMSASDMLTGQLLDAA